MFLDPGRVKRGILPNEQMGRAIRAGGRYCIVVDSLWREEHDVPLVSSFRREFVVSAPDERVIDPAAWRITPPARATREPLVVVFSKGLDHGFAVARAGRAYRAVNGRPFPPIHQTWKPA